jgi:hypothetical protein
MTVSRRSTELPVHSLSSNLRVAPAGIIVALGSPNVWVTRGESKFAVPLQRLHAKACTDCP